jgi:hypothetical protein
MADQDQTVRPGAADASATATEAPDDHAIPGFAQPAAALLPPGALRYDTDEPRRKSRLPMLLAVILGAVTLTLAIVLGPTAWLMLQQKDATLVLPDTAAGLTRDNSPEAAATAELLLDVLSAGVELDSGVSGVYQDPVQGKSSSILFIGGTALLPDPEGTLDLVFELLAVQTGNVGTLQEIDAGNLGGTMKCGAADSSGATMAVCGWADYGSVAFALFPDRTITDAAPVLQALRPIVQSR